MLVDGNGRCSCFFEVVYILRIIIVIRNLNNRFGLIYRKLFQLLGIGFVSCLVETLVTYGIITVSAECDDCCMDFSIVRPSADAVAAACGGGYLRCISVIKVPLINCDCQSLVIVVVLAVMYVTLIK